MGKINRKRGSTSKDKSTSKHKDPLADDETDDTSSDSENESNGAGDRKRIKIAEKDEDKEWSGNESNGQSSAGNESEIEAEKVKKSTKRTNASNTTTTKRRKIQKTKGWAKSLEVEAIVTHSIIPSRKNRRYRVKLKDDPKTIWLSAQNLRSICPELVREYNDGIKNNKLVDAIISHEKQKNLSYKYLLQWANKSKGETWETRETAMKVCPNLLTPYIEKIEEEIAEANAVTAILKYKLTKHRASKYLVKWKDRKRGETWETAKRCVALCPEILDKFTMKNPDCVPRIFERSYPLPMLPRKPQNIKYRKKQYGILEDFDEDVDWEVERIMDVCFKKDKTREFLIRWRGFRSAYDSWEPEKHLHCPELIDEFMQKKAKRDDVHKMVTPLRKKSKRSSRKLTTESSHEKSYATSSRGKSSAKSSREKSSAKSSRRKSAATSSRGKPATKKRAGKPIAQTKSGSTRTGKRK